MCQIDEIIIRYCLHCWVLCHEMYAKKARFYCALLWIMNKNCAMKNKTGKNTQRQREIERNCTLLSLRTRKRNESTFIYIWKLNRAVSIHCLRLSHFNVPLNCVKFSIHYFSMFGVISSALYFWLAVICASFWTSVYFFFSFFFYWFSNSID